METYRKLDQKDVKIPGFALNSTNLLYWIYGDGLKRWWQRSYKQIKSKRYRACKEQANKSDPSEYCCELLLLR